MRPIAVLILVLGAVAALTFAILSISSGSGSGRQGVGPVVGPAAHASETSPGPANIAKPDGVIDPVAPVVVDERTAIESDDGGAWANSLVVRVLGPDGFPVEGAKVHLMKDAGSVHLRTLVHLMNEGAPAKPFRTVTSNDEGKVTFRALQPRKDWTVVVEHETYSRIENGGIQVPEKGSIEELVRLERGFALIGYVYDKSTSAPLEGAKLILDDPIFAVLPSHRKSPSRLEVYADAQGRYEFPNIPPGQRSLMCSAEGFATQIHNSMSFMGEVVATQDKTIYMEEGKAIAGRVVRPDRTGFKGATVDAICHSSVVSSRGSAVSLEDGEFLIESLGEGAYTLRTTVNGWDTQPMQVQAGDTNVVIVLAEQGTVMGRVVAASNGRPIPNFTCNVRQMHPTNKAFGRVAATKSFRDRRDGSFEVGGIPEGTYVVQGDAPGYASSYSEPFQITQGLATPDIEVRMTRGGGIKGRVVDSRTGAGIPGAQVSTNDNNWIDSEFTQLLKGMMSATVKHQKVTTDADGYFEMKLMTAENYQVVVRDAEYSMWVKNDVQVFDGGVTEIPTIQISKGSIVRGTVFSAEGGVAAGVNVDLHPKTTGSSQHAVHARTDAQGRYVLRNAAPGVYKLSASRTQAGASASPFQVIVDMRNSEVEMAVLDGQEYTQDLYLGEN